MRSLKLATLTENVSHYILARPLYRVLFLYHVIERIFIDFWERRIKRTWRVGQIKQCIARYRMGRGSNIFHPLFISSFRVISAVIIYHMQYAIRRLHYRFSVTRLRLPPPFFSG